MSDEDILQGLDLLGDWLDAKGYTEEAGLCTRAMDKINLLKAIASKAIREQIPLGEEIDTLRAENEKLRAENETHKEIAVRETMNVATLRAALKPFADAVKDEHNWKYDINVDDFRAAAAALKETGDE